MSKVEIGHSRVAVTGAGSGIGHAVALRCARMGAEVVAIDIDGDSAEATAAACAAADSISSGYQCDVADAEAVEALAATIEDERGAVDVIVNNAGVGIYGPFLEASIEDWEWLRGVNLDGVVHGCHSFGLRMVDRGHGHVVNMASGAGYIPNRNMAAYCASKAAVVMLSQCLRGDWASRGVGVSVICPGVIATPIAANSRMAGSSAAKRDRAIQLLGRGHSPDVVAKAVVSAVERNRELVPAGIESTAAYHLMRLSPGPLRGLVTRATLP
ncbi:MAG: SDR family NAD(P)-dependent oxidoreductase [Actinomycetota bacterium]|nr:SDR family NAD(P)-dependent oxidoreductase [Actinomycetota bacterium]